MIMDKKILVVLLGLLACAILFPTTSHAKTSLEQEAVHAMLLYCVPVLTSLDELDIAEIEKLPRLPPASEALYVKAGEGSRVFALPGTNENILLIAHQIPICAIAAKQIDPAEFIKKLDMWMATSVFKLTSKINSPNGDVFREYKGAKGSANFNMTVNLRKQPSANGVQVLMTTQRIGGIQQE
jgi:hypothetical protein